MTIRHVTDVQDAFVEERPSQDEVRRRWRRRFPDELHVRLDDDTVAVIDDASDDLLLVTKGNLREGMPRPRPYWLIRSLCARQANWWPMVQTMLQELIDRGQGNRPLFWPRVTAATPQLACTDAVTSQAMDDAARNVLHARSVPLSGVAMYRITPRAARAALIAAGEWR